MTSRYERDVSRARWVVVSSVLCVVLIKPHVTRVDETGDARHICSHACQHIHIGAAFAIGRMRLITELAKSASASVPHAGSSKKRSASPGKIGKAVCFSRQSRSTGTHEERLSLAGDHALSIARRAKRGWRVRGSRWQDESHQSACSDGGSQIDLDELMKGPGLT